MLKCSNLCFCSLQTPRANFVSSSSSVIPMPLKFLPGKQWNSVLSCMTADIVQQPLQINHSEPGDFCSITVRKQ